MGSLFSAMRGAIKHQQRRRWAATSPITSSARSSRNAECNHQQQPMQAQKTTPTHQASADKANRQYMMLPRNAFSRILNAEHYHRQQQRTRAEAATAAALAEHACASCYNSELLSLLCALFLSFCCVCVFVFLFALKVFFRGGFTAISRSPPSVFRERRGSPCV